jgi:hypothetical protein
LKNHSLFILTILFLILGFQGFAQQHSENQSSQYQLLEDSIKPYKIIHAEPLYIDLIRDLGARKGEKEWNVGFGLTDYLQYDKYEALVEYEWAVADKLGLEVEVPVNIYSMNPGSSETPNNKIESFKTAIQWTVLVNTNTRTSAALGYINELAFFDLNTLDKNTIVEANVFNPFLIVAQRIGKHWHSLLYTGPAWEYNFDYKTVSSLYEAHLSFHYMIPGSRNFVGLETNSYTEQGVFSATLRPQMRLEITDKILAGVVVSAPLVKDEERLGFFVRLIYEP